jgi:hypothetical protein
MCLWTRFEPSASAKPSSTTTRRLQRPAPQLQPLATSANPTDQATSRA